MIELTNIINHFVLVIDESTSMYQHKESVVKVVDGLTAHLAEKSQDLNQETRLSVYAFNSRGTPRCLVWDIDVLRMPSIKGMYSPHGMTALVDATLLAIEDNQTVPQKYGDHSFVVYVITDGQENNSRRVYELNPQYVSSLADNWSLAVFVPNKRGVTDARTWGFPADNITIWDTTSTAGVEAVGKVMRDTSTHIMTARKQGVRKFTNLFKLNAVSVEDIKKNLKPLSWAEYTTYTVRQDGRIDEFVSAASHRDYRIGEGFYQLTKTETIQPQKQIAVMLTQNRMVYGGANARKLLGLPENESVRVKPDNYPDYTIFVQSTSPNRKLLAGTTLLLMPYAAAGAVVTAGSQGR